MNCSYIYLHVHLFTFTHLLAIQPCDDNGGCSHICAVIDGQAQCYCPIGLQLSMPGGTQCMGKKIINVCAV